MAKINRRLDIFIALLIYVFLDYIILTLLVDKYSILTILSFIFVSTMVLILLIICFNKKNTYYEAIISVYYMLFFIFAPVIQLGIGRFPIPFPIKETNIILANVINGLFLLSYIVFRFSVKESNKIKNEVVFSKQNIRIIWIVIVIITTISLPTLMNQIFNRIRSVAENQGIDLIIKKCIFFIPLILVFYYISEYKKNKKGLVLLIVSILILILFKNPLTEKRNALGPIYLSLFMFIFQNKITTRKFTIIFVVLFIIGFPLMATLTHSNDGLGNIIESNNMLFNIDIILNQFKEMHFDAFENINVVIDYVSTNGIMFGQNLLGAILFFIPRLVWHTKPLSSGQIVGNYLIENHGFNFNNLSCTITAEAYLGFGILGVVIFAFILAMIGRKTAKYVSSSNYMSLISWYCIIHLFFLMRGDLMNGVAYLIGPLIAVYVLPNILNKLCKIKIKK